MTRMWLTNPKIMCRNHLLGEHKEIHQLVGSIIKGHKLDGYVKNNCIEITSIQSRHDELVKELLARGYKHHSPLKPFTTEKLPESIKYFKINQQSSLKDLINRCEKCKQRYENHSHKPLKV